MITIEKTMVAGMEPAIRGMRNPKNSWHRSDSYYQTTTEGQDEYILGQDDERLAMQLASCEPVHRKFLRMIVVWADITAPLYWWKEFDTYKVGTVANSCSTMHKLASKEFVLDDFSHEHLNAVSLADLRMTIDKLNANRMVFNATGDKEAWWQMVQLLPSSYNQKRTVCMNYEVLANIYRPDCRLHHKLDEWNVLCDGSFCRWIQTLPNAHLITGEDEQ